MNTPILAIKFTDNEGRSLNGKCKFNLPVNDGVGAWHTRKKKALGLDSSGYHSIHTLGIGHWLRSLSGGSERCWLVEISGRFDSDCHSVVSENIRFIKELPLLRIGNLISIINKELVVTSEEQQLNENIRRLVRFTDSISQLGIFVASPLVLGHMIIKKPNCKFKNTKDIKI